jgi:hypothetical protein
MHLLVQHQFIVHLSQHRQDILQLDHLQPIVIVMDGLFTNVDLTLSLLKIAETELWLTVQTDALLEIPLTAMDGLSKDVPLPQPSLEHGADPSFQLNALQELQEHQHQHQHQEEEDVFQSKHQHQPELLQLIVIVMDGLFTNVDLTPSLLKIAETELWLTVQTDALLEIPPTAMHGLSKDVPTSQPSLEHGAEPSFQLNALQELQEHQHQEEEDVFQFKHQSKHQHQHHTLQTELLQLIVIVMDGLFTSVDLTLSLLKIAETELWLTVQSDALLKISPTAMDMLSRDAQTSQPSLEHGAEQSLLLNALQEQRDFNQTMSHQLAIVMDNLFTSVDLTQLQTLIADRNSLTNVFATAQLQELIVQTVLLLPTQDVLISQPMSEELAELQSSLDVKEIV